MSSLLRQMIMHRIRLNKGGTPAAPETPKPIFKDKPVGPETEPAISPGNHVTFASPTQTLGSATQRKDLMSGSDNEKAATFDGHDDGSGYEDKLEHLPSSAGLPEGYKGAPAKPVPGQPILAGVLRAAQTGDSQYAGVMNELHDHFHAALNRAHAEFNSVKAAAAGKGEDWHKSYQYLGTGPIAARMYNLREILADGKTSPEDRKKASDEYQFYADNYSQLSAAGNDRHKRALGEVAIPGYVSDKGMSADDPASLFKEPKNPSQTTHAKDVLSKAGMGLNGEVHDLLYNMREELRDSHKGLRGADQSVIDAHRRKLEAYYQLEASVSNMELGSHTMAQANNPVMNAFASWYRDGAMKALATQIDLINNSPAYKPLKGRFGEVAQGEDGVHRVRWETPEQAANAMMLLYAVGPTSANEVPDSNWKFAMGTLEDGLHQWNKKHGGNPEAMARGPSIMDLFAHAQEDRGHLEHYSEFGEQSPKKFIKGAWLTMSPEERAQHFDFAKASLVPGNRSEGVNSPEDLTKFIQYGAQDEEEEGGEGQDENESEVPVWSKDAQGNYKLLPIKKGFPSSVRARGAHADLKSAIKKQIDKGLKDLSSSFGAHSSGKKLNDLHAEAMDSMLRSEPDASGKSQARYYDENGNKITKAAADKIATQKILSSGSFSGIDPAALKSVSSKSELNKVINDALDAKKGEFRSPLDAAITNSEAESRANAGQSTVSDMLTSIFGKKYKDDKYPGLRDKAAAFLDTARKMQGDTGVGDEFDASFGNKLVYTQNAKGEFSLLNKSLQARPESVKRAIRMAKLFSRAGHASDLVRGKNMPHEDKVDLMAKAIYGDDAGAVFHDIINTDNAKQMYPGMTPDEQARAHARNLAEMLAKHEGDSQSSMLAAFMAGAHDNHLLNKIVPVSRNSFFTVGDDGHWKYNDEASLTPEQRAQIPDGKKQGGFDLAGQKYGPYGRSVAGGPSAAFIHMLSGAITPPEDRYVADRVMSEMHGQALGRRFSGVPENEMQRAAWNHGVGVLADVLGRHMGGARPTVDQIQAIVWASQQAQASALGASNPTSNLYTGAEDVYRIHRLHAQRIIQQHGGSKDPDVQNYVNDARQFLANSSPVRIKTLANGSFYGGFSSIPEVRNAQGGYDLVGHGAHEERRKTLANLQTAGQNAVTGFANDARAAAGLKFSKGSTNANGGRSGSSGRVGKGGKATAGSLHGAVRRYCAQRLDARKEAVPPVPPLHGKKPGSPQSGRPAATGNIGKARPAHDVSSRARLKYSGQFMRSMLLGTSATAGKFRKQFDGIAQQVGVKLDTFSGVGDAQSNTSPATAHIADSAVDPDLARYLAAWSGLLGGRTSVMVFHPHPQGEDSFHSVTIPVTDMQKVRAAFDQKGIKHRTIIPGAKNTHIMVYDPRRMMRNNLAQIAEDFDGHVLESTGRAEFIGRPANRPGTDPAADAREHYRRIVADFEERRGVPNQAGGSPDGNSGGASVSGSTSVGRSPSGGAVVRGLTYKGGSFTPAEEQKGPPQTKMGSPERFKRKLKYSHFEPKGQHASIVKAIANDTPLHQMEKAHEDLNTAIVNSHRKDTGNSTELAARLKKNMQNEPARADHLIDLLSRHLGAPSIQPADPHDQTGAMAHRISSLFTGMGGFDPSSALEKTQGKVAGMVTPASIAQHVARHAQQNIPGIKEAALDHANLHSGGVARLVPHGPAGRSWVNLDAIWGHGDEQKERARVVDASGHPEHYFPTMMREFFSRPVRMAREHPETTDWLLGLLSGTGRRIGATG